MSSSEPEQQASLPIVWTYSWVNGKETLLPVSKVSEHPDGAEVYFLPAESKNGRRTKDDIYGSHFALADFDPNDSIWKDGRETFQGALEAWRTEFRARLEAHEPRLSLIIDSGRGFQAGYRLTNMASDKAQVEAARYALAGAFGAEHRDACHDISRVFRMPGTVNHKTGRRAAIVRWEPDNRVALADLPQEQPPADQRSGTHAVTDAVVPNPDLDSVEALLSEGLLVHLIRFGEYPADHQIVFKSRNEAEWHCVCALVRLGLPDGVILGIHLDERNKISDRAFWIKSKDKRVRRRNPEQYVSDMLSRARDDVGSKAVISNRTLSLDDNGKPHKTPLNFRIALDLLGVIIRHNEFTDTYEVAGLEDLGTSLNDPIITRIRIMFEEQFHWFPTKEFAVDMLKDCGVRNKYHPVRDYLSALTWDRVPRLDTWLIECGGIEDTPLHRAFSRLVLMAAVRRIQSPGVKFDQMLVIESAQGWNKSTALRVLAVYDHWFTDKIPLGADSKLVIEDTRGKWIAEVAELHGMSKADIDRVKAQLSRTSDRARMAYATVSVDVARQFVLIGTTNNDRYLRDLTGNRRIWPVTITKPMDLAWLRAWRDQLWAEAFAQEGPLALDPSLYEAAGKVQEARRQESAMAGAIAHHLGDKSGKIWEQDVWTLVGVPMTSRDGKLTQLRADMEQAGWTFERQLRFGTNRRYPGYWKGDAVARLTTHEVQLSRVDGKPVIHSTEPNAAARGKAVLMLDQVEPPF